MADQKPPDQPSGDSASHAESGMPSEQELDEVLARASALAADLSAQVGEADGPDRTPDPPDVVLTDEGSQPDLEAELGELERLVANTGKELDAKEGASAVASTGDQPPPPPAVTEAPAPQTAVPDFMSEFTRPEGLEEGTTALPERSASSSLRSSVDTPPPPQRAVKPKEDPAGAVSPAVLDVPNGEATSDDAPNDASPRTPAVRENETGRGNEAPPESAGPVATIVRRLEPAAIKVAELTVDVLETIDRPIAGVGTGIRQIIGWIAMATLGTFLIVYLYSLV